MHDIVYGLEFVILYIGRTLGDASQHFESIKSELENNELLRTVYGNLVPAESFTGRKWTNRHIETTNGINVLARGRGKGRGANVKGRRPTKIIVDDVEDDEQVRRPEQRIKLHNWLYDVIFLSLDADRGKIKMIGTVLHELSEIIQFYKKHGGIFRRAIENGESIWPKRFSLEKLAEEKKRIGTRSFNRELMNNPSSEDEAHIKKEWIEGSNYVVLPMNEQFDGIMHIDPQSGESSEADEYSITVLYIQKGAVHRFCVEQRAGQASQLEQTKEYVRTWLSHREIIRACGVEKVLNQTSTWQLLQDWKAGNLDLNPRGLLKGMPGWIDESDRNIPIIERSPKGKDKKTRLEMFEPDFERGEIHLRPEMTELAHQLMHTMGSDVEHDDRADSLVGALELAFDKGLGRKKLTAKMSDAAEEDSSHTVMGDVWNKTF